MKRTQQRKSMMVQKLSNGNGKLEEQEQMRIMTGAMVSVLKEMERELWKCRNRCEQLEKIVRLQQQDIESLRYEIHWKDSRIDFLQTQLQQLDVTRNTSRSS
ncbi:hypothetical protein WUBG_13849 [Wuchereria bancrofti]|uniref:Uncharacterized protein n=1 Tax=Wuchereria bancrofti TaxID=6293 RepID=J9DZH6_WUCBA|nr:hypothetical protein WUBG_13849 [Wuchereria bancrofti]